MAYVDKPWDGSASRFTIQQWKASCLIDTGKGDPSSKSRYKLPIREPNGDINLAAVRNAASRINQTQAPASEKSAAQAKLTAIEKAQKMGDHADSKADSGKAS